MSKVKVFNKVTGAEQYITRQILNSAAGKHFELISDGHPNDADLYDSEKEYPAPKKAVDKDALIKSQLQEIENLKAKVASQTQNQTLTTSQAIEINEIRKKPGRKPKTNPSSTSPVEV